MWVKSPRAMLRVEIMLLQERENPAATRGWELLQQIRSHLSVKDAGPYWQDFLGPRFTGLLGCSLDGRVTWSCNALAQVMENILSRIAMELADYGGKQPVVTPLGPMVSAGTQIFEHVRDLRMSQLCGQFFASKVAYMLAPSHTLTKESSITTNAFADLVSAASFWFPFRGFCVMSERPTTIALDESARLHNLKGPALKWPDGFSIHAVAGLAINPQFIENPETLTVTRIEDENNTEIRRAMIQLYGEQRFLKDSGAEVVSYGRDGAKLWARSFAADDNGPFQMVELKNSTPEPDGSIKTYFLRVPPTVQTADAAIAWTFGLDGKAYKPEKET